MTPTVKLGVIGSGTAQGTLAHHPGRLLVHTYRDGAELVVQLWLPHPDGNTFLGSGRLTKHDGEWRGEVEELKARWVVTGVVGTGVLEFGEGK